MRHPPLQAPLLWQVYLGFWIAGVAAAVWPLPALCCALLLALAEDLLGNRGACRVHGGGFAGTIQAFVPLDLLPAFTAEMEAAAGPGTCYTLRIRSSGSVPLID